MSWRLDGEIDVEVVTLNQPQRTIAGPAAFAGIGLHSGCEGIFTAEPAAPGYGIRFGTGPSAATAPPTAFAYSQDHTTSVLLPGIQLRCVEHFMSALHGLGITNLYVRCHAGDEFPILDGSARGIASALRAAEIVEQEAAAQAVRINAPFALADASTGRSITCAPGAGLSVMAEIDFPLPIGRQSRLFVSTPQAYESQLASARTFLKDPVDASSLAELRGGRLKGLAEPCPVIFYNREKFLCPLRFEDEPVRHKITDFLGDIYTIGMTIEGAFHLVRPGHELTRRFVELLEAALERRGVDRGPTPQRIPAPVRQKAAASAGQSTMAMPTVAAIQASERSTGTPSA